MNRVFTWQSSVDKRLAFVWFWTQHALHNPASRPLTLKTKEQVTALKQYPVPGFPPTVWSFVPDARLSRDRVYAESDSGSLWWSGVQRCASHIKSPMPRLGAQ